MPRIERSIEVGVPVHTAYNQWTQFEEFPRFMHGVREVKQLDDTHLHWMMDIGGKPVEWDAEITEQIPDQCISWRSNNGTKSSATVRFAPLDEQRTSVTFTVDVVNLAGKNLKEQELGSRTEEDLQRFARFLEERGHETGAWRAEVHQGQVSDAGQQEASGSAARDSEPAQQPEQELRQRQDSTRLAHRGALDEGGRATERWASDTARAMTREAERFTNDIMGLSLGRFSGPLAFGGMPFFASFFNSLEAPLSMMRRMSEEMDREMESLVWGAPGTTRRALVAQAAPMWSPSIDVRRQGDSWLICADLPGVDRKDVQIEIVDGQLLITGERREERDEVVEDDGQRLRRIERVQGRFARRLPLPEGAQAEQAEATMSDGVLEIRLPASPEGPQRRIEIRAAEPASRSRDQEQRLSRPGAEAGLTVEAQRAARPGGAASSFSSQGTGQQ
ncbi:Hsp20 family protein [Eleftheria terrae]|uniref:Hsp20 family protein n=1 Tax=Eleftheria terrae TaxID=1597781 RepID=UPI00263B73DC|nr:Hsp20 family protein [Eleftheria terrae]WKB51763.1 Hsp20 family protein [Eleftheria terrae]